MRRRIVIVGGGIAGLASAFALCRRRGFEVTLLERESTLCQHASGSNAAIYRPLEADPELARLARASMSSFRLLSRESALVDERGFVLLHPDPARMLEVQDSSRRGGVDSTLLAPDQLSRVLKRLTPPPGYHGLFAPSGGIIDIHALNQSLARSARALGARIVTGAQVTALLTSAERVSGIRTFLGDELSADAVVIAGGAWCAGLGQLVGCSLELQAVRRHLALLEPERALEAGFPIVWCLDPEVYFRAELNRVLASPCDATLVEGTVVRADIDALSPLSQKLAQLRTGLEAARLVRHWACLRTFAPDKRPVIGPDPRLRGLYWLAGLGGFGMTMGVAAGEELANTLASDRASARFGVERLLEHPAPA